MLSFYLALLAGITHSSPSTQHESKVRMDRKACARTLVLGMVIAFVTLPELGASLRLPL